MILPETDSRLVIKSGEHLAVSKRVVTENHPRHWHNYFEIEIITSGSGSCVINNTKYGFNERNVFFLTPTDFHLINIDGTTRLINLSFDEEYIPELVPYIFSQNKKAFFLERESLDRLISACELLLHEYEIKGESQEELLRYVIRSILRRNTRPTFSDELQLNGIRRAIVYMEMHFKERITLSVLANEAGYNPTYFSELYKKVTGETYIEALAKLRIGYARSLLTSGYSVNDSCFMSGFGSLSSFGSSFKKHCGISPSKYKKISQK